MTDASFRASCYALMIEANDERKLLSKRKTFAPVVFGSLVFSPAQLKMFIHCKKILAIYHDFLEHSHILWETTLQTFVLTDNISVTRSKQFDVIFLSFELSFRTMNISFERSFSTTEGPIHLKLQKRFFNLDCQQWIAI